MDDNMYILSFEGEQTIEKAAQIRSRLLEALGGPHKEIVLNLSGLERVDLSFLQLLYSAGLEADNLDKKICLKEDVPPSFLETVRLAGYGKDMGNRCHFLSAQLEEG